MSTGFSHHTILILLESFQKLKQFQQFKIVSFILLGNSHYDGLYNLLQRYFDIAFM